LGYDIITAKWLDPQLRNSPLIVINLTVSIFCVCGGGGGYPRLSTTGLTQTGKILLDENGVEREMEKKLESILPNFNLFSRFCLLSLAIFKYRQYFLILQTLKLNNKKMEKNICFTKKKIW
jgi:hypothetical protein